MKILTNLILVVSFFALSTQAMAAHHLKGKRLLCLPSVELRKPYTSGAQSIDQDELKLDGPSEYIAHDFGTPAIEVDFDRVGFNGYGAKQISFEYSGSHFAGKILVTMGLYRTDGAAASDVEAFELRVRRVKSKLFSGSVVYENLDISLPIPSAGDFAPRFRIHSGDADVSGIEMNCSVLNKD